MREVPTWGSHVSCGQAFETSCGYIRVAPKQEMNLPLRYSHLSWRTSIKLMLAAHLGLSGHKSAYLPRAASTRQNYKLPNSTGFATFAAAITTRCVVSILTTLSAS